jgi:CBS domain-containing protein
LSHAADTVTRQAIADFIDSAGTPPSDFRWIALGSHGRGELHCASDQDSGLVWVDEQSARSGYAADLAASVITALADWGLARCSGGFTADQWSHDVAHWHGLLRSWVREPEPHAVIEAEVFLDFRPIAGALHVDDLSDVIHSGAESPLLLHGMAVAATSFPPNLTVFGHLRGDVVESKRAGLNALVLLARLFALQAGSRALGTQQRLADAGAAGVLSDSLVAELLDAHRMLTTLRLNCQLQAIDEGRSPDNRIDFRALTSAQRHELETGLRAIRSAQKAAEFVFRTEL